MPFFIRGKEEREDKGTGKVVRTDPILESRKENRLQSPASLVSSCHTEQGTPYAVEVHVDEAGRF